MTPLVFVARGRALYVGPGLDLAPHRNATATVAMALEAPFALGADANGRHEDYRAVLIPPGTLHHLQARGPMPFLYLDPASDDLAHLRMPERIEWPAMAEAAAEDAIGWALQAVGVPARPVVRLHRTLVRQIICPEPDRRTLRSAGREPRSRGVLRMQRGGERKSPSQELDRDFRIAVLAALDAAPQNFASIDDAATHAGLSASRFGHVFREELGLPFRRYRIWRRMAVVAAALRAGRSMTDAAYDAGFASSAHFSATFREMFGLPPSALVRLRTRFVLA